MFLVINGQGWPHKTRGQSIHNRNGSAVVPHLLCQPTRRGPQEPTADNTPVPSVDWLQIHRNSPVKFVTEHLSGRSYPPEGDIFGVRENT